MSDAQHSSGSYQSAFYCLFVRQSCLLGVLWEVVTQKGDDETHLCSFCVKHGSNQRPKFQRAALCSRIPPSVLPSMISCRSGSLCSRANPHLQPILIICPPKHGAGQPAAAAVAAGNSSQRGSKPVAAALEGWLRVCCCVVKHPTY